MRSFLLATATFSAVILVNLAVEAGAQSVPVVEPAPVLAQEPAAPLVIPSLFQSRDMWRQVYELVPHIPLENHYVDEETGDVDEDNTLLGRMIRYHLIVRGRFPVFRLDWKLTMADYLGANVPIGLNEYPGSDTLETNPMRRDMEIIASLTRAQRDELVTAFLLTFYPEYPEALEQTAPLDLPSATESPVADPASDVSEQETESQSDRPLSPSPGDAQLLMPLP